MSELCPFEISTSMRNGFDMRYMRSVCSQVLVINNQYQRKMAQISLIASCSEVLKCKS